MLSLLFVIYKAIMIKYTHMHLFHVPSGSDVLNCDVMSCFADHEIHSALPDVASVASAQMCSFETEVVAAFVDASVQIAP